MIPGTDESLKSANSLSGTTKPLRARLNIGLIIALLAALTYLPAVQNDFVDWDDTIYVTRNSHVKAGLNPSGIAYAWTTFDSNNWIPLTWLSYELDATLFGLNPVVFHATNNLLHTLNAWLLFRVLRQFTGSLYRSAVVAALFSVHPLHVESVAWVSERKDVLSTCGLLLTLLAYRQYALRPTRIRFALVFCTMTLGLLAKSMLVTLPLLLCLVDYWPLQRVALSAGEESLTHSFLRTPWQLLVEKIPLLILALVDGLLTIAAQQAAMPGSGVISLRLRIENAILAYGWYLGKTFWPVGLCAYYRHPHESLNHAVVGGCGVILLAVTVVVVVRGRRHPDLIFGWFWFLIALLPVIGVFQVGMQAHADRYAYVPHIGLFTMIVWGVHLTLHDRSFGKWIAGGLAIVSIGACTVLTSLQIQTWRDTEALWNHALRFDSYNTIAHFQLGDVSLRRQDTAAALQHYSDVFVSLPSAPEAILNLGIVHEQRKEWDVAADYYHWLLRLKPKHPVAMQRLASLPRRPDSSHFSRLAIVDEQTQIGVRQLLGGNLPEAAVAFQKAADLDLKDVQAQNNAARILEDVNRPDQARAYYARALIAKPGEVEATHGLDRIDKRRTEKSGSSGRSP